MERRSNLKIVCNKLKLGSKSESYLRHRRFAPLKGLPIILFRIAPQQEEWSMQTGLLEKFSQARKRKIKVAQKDAKAMRKAAIVSFLLLGNSWTSSE